MTPAIARISTGFPVRRATGCVGATIAAALLVACASPEPRFYSLAPGPTATERVAPRQGDATAGTAVTAPTSQAAAMWIEVAPVRVPERLNRPQLMVTEGDPATGQLKLLEESRWSAPLPDEFRDALSQRLQTVLGAVDIYQQGLSGVEPVYRVTTEVVRMDATLGQQAGATIQWTVRRLPDGRVVSGRTEADLPASGGVESAVAAYRQIVASAAAEIAQGVASMSR